MSSSAPLSAAPGFARRLGAIHDAISRFGFGIAAAMLAVVVGSFCYEVVSRYAFAAPTEWASPLVSYAMVSMIFVAMPELTRRGAHISINMLLEHMSSSRAAAVQALIRMLAAAACFFAAWFSGSQTLEQFDQSIWTPPPFVLPKWVVSVFVPYGMLSSGAYFVRQLIAGGPAPATAESVS